MLLALSGGRTVGTTLSSRFEILMALQGPGAEQEQVRLRPLEGEAVYRVGRLRRESASIVTAPRRTRAVTMNWVDASKPTRPIPL
jgi:hypothetical protein